MPNPLDFQTTDARLRLLKFTGFLLFAAYGWLYSTRGEMPVAGAFLFAGAVGCLVAGSGWRWIANVFVIGATVLLTVFSWKHFVDYDYDPVHLIERSMRIALGPLVLLSALPKANVHPVVSWIARVAIAFTFIGHGMPALGVVPTSEKWFFMFEATLGLGKEGAKVFLLVIGILDVVAAMLILLPKRQLVLAGLIYCTAWGLLTATARPVAHFATEGLDPWLAEGLLRAPHGLVPLYLWLCLRRGVAR